MLAPLPAFLALVLTLFAPTIDAGAQDLTRQERQLDKKEKLLREAEVERDSAFEALRSEYDGLEQIFKSEEAAGSPPPVALKWLEEKQLTADDWTQQLDEHRKAGEFYDWWNTELYLHSRAAKKYSEAVLELEEAFIAVEKLRSPQRFEKGFDAAPPGMILVPSDRFPQGPHIGRTTGFPNSAKEKINRIKAFYLDRTEVSCQAYWKFLLAQPAGLRPQHLPLGWELDGDDLPVIPEGWEEMPVTGVSWVSATAYARWLGRRLPTEMEWEAAAAGNQKRVYPSGDRYDALQMNCLATRVRMVRPPKEYHKDRTPLGIVCMGGNASEWTADLYVSSTDASKRAKKVAKPRAYAEAVVRGGSYLSSAEGCRNNYRQLYQAVGAQYRNIGFRCAMDAP